MNIILYNNLNCNLTIDDILISMYFLVIVDAIGLVAYVVVEEAPGNVSKLVFPAFRLGQKCSYVTVQKYAIITMSAFSLTCFLFAQAATTNNH